jgi:hypothetical protein
MAILCFTSRVFWREPLERRQKTTSKKKFNIKKYDISERTKIYSKPVLFVCVLIPRVIMF